MADRYGMWVSKKGNPANTSNERQLIVDSENSFLKILKSGTCSFTTDGSGNGSKSIKHGEKYSPAFYVFRKGTMQHTFLDASSYTNAFIPLSGQNSNWITNNNTFYAYTTSSELIIGSYLASASTTYSFKYYLLVDPAQTTQRTGGIGQESFGIKASKTGFDAGSTLEENLSFSSDYRTIKERKGGIAGYNITLPALGGDFGDKTPEEGTYADFRHALGYAPFYLAFYESGTTQTEVPSSIVESLNDLGINPTDYFSQAIESWCDKTRIRISFWRKAYWNDPTQVYVPNSFSSTTIRVKVFVFEEDLGLE